MNEEKKPISDMSDSLITFLWSQRRRLIIICALTIVASTIVSYILPVRYRATAVIFSAQDNNISKTLLSDQPYSRDYIGFGDEKNCEQMMQVLRSTEVMQAMANKFDLMKNYGIPADAKDKYALLKEDYDDNFSFEITEYQSIKIDVYDKKPEQAAAMANGVIWVADSVYRQIVNQRAQAALNVAEQQVDSTRHQIRILEDSMNFFRRLGIISYDNQVKEYTRGYAEAQAKGSPQSVKDIEDKLKPFQEYGKQYWTTAYNVGDAYRWMSQVKVAYIQAKANVDKSIPVFFVAQNAVVPDKKAYPIRWLVVFGSTLAAFFFSIIILLLINRFSIK